MPRFSVSVEKKEYRTGSVEVTAKNSDAALRKVADKIESDKLQTTDITWGVPEYEDCSFATTGDVDELSPKKKG